MDFWHKDGTYNHEVGRNYNENADLFLIVGTLFCLQHCGSLSIMQNPGLHPRLTELESLGNGVMVFLLFFSWS